MASGRRPSWGLGLGDRGARGRGLVSVWPGPGHVRVRKPPTPASRPRPRPGLPRTMGSILSRRIAGVEDIDIQANSAYRYPPKSGERPARPLARSRARPGPERGVGRARPRGALRRGCGGLCSAHGPPCASQPGAPRDLHSDRGWGSGLPAPSRRGDLGSVTSSVRASAPSYARKGDALGNSQGGGEVRGVTLARG